VPHVGLTTLSFPVPPPGPSFLVEVFERAVTSRARVIHFCQITNLTGQIFPTQEICRMARARGIRTIVDGAHAFARCPFVGRVLECDYDGTSLHKWLTAPIGTGFLYVRREYIPSLWPMQPAAASLARDIRRFEENVYTTLAVVDTFASVLEEVARKDGVWPLPPRRATTRRGAGVLRRPCSCRGSCQRQK
jgi:selenocysteine lyase/cysteine desulfurase